jgi:hypothetical protein
VVITSANADHRAMALEAAEQGIPVLLEKPVATTWHDAEAIVQAFRAAGLTLATAFPCPFSPALPCLWTPSSWRPRAAAGRAKHNRGTCRGAFSSYRTLRWRCGHRPHRTRGGPPAAPYGAEVASVYAEVGHGLYHAAWDDSGLLSIRMENGVFATFGLLLEPPSDLSDLGRCDVARRRRAGERRGRSIRPAPAITIRRPWRGRTMCPAGSRGALTWTPCSWTISCSGADAPPSRSARGCLRALGGGPSRLRVRAAGRAGGDRRVRAKGRRLESHHLPEGACSPWPA